MIKTGKLHLLILLAFILTAHSAVIAQDLQVSASLSQDKVYAGEQAQLDLSISGTSLGSIKQPVLPEIPGFRWISNRTSKGTSYSIINGKAQVTYTFNYLLIAQEPGEYTVPTISLSINGQTYETNAIPFKVLDPETIDTGEAERAPEIYVRLEPSVKDPVVGEQVLVEIVLYFRDGIDVSSYQATPGWKAEGFWKEELQNPQRAQTSTSIINGVRYQRARLLQYAIFPTKSGELTLSPFEISVALRQRNRTNSIFDMGFDRERRNLETLPVSLNVKPLPDIDNAVFIGAVGNFEITREIKPQEVLVGESIEVLTRIEGSGNVPLVNKPEYDYPDGLELYNPQENSSLKRTNRQISGSRTFTDILIARNEGSYSIPELTVAFYNPDRNRYETKVLPALTFTAQRDPDAISVAETESRFDIRPVTGLAQWQQSETTALYRKTGIWLSLAFSLLLLGAAFAYRQFNERLNSDTAFARSRKAETEAMATLKEAEAAGDLKQGYYHIEKALTQYITDKLNLPPAGLSSSELAGKLEEKTGKETAQQVRRMLQKCETIAYAPNASQAGLEKDIEECRNLILQTGKKL